MPLLDTVLFIMDLIPVLFICNLLSTFQYTDYDEIVVEAECVNRAFEGYRLLFYKEGTEQVTNIVGILADLGIDQAHNAYELNQDVTWRNSLYTKVWSDIMKKWTFGIL